MGSAAPQFWLVMLTWSLFLVASSAGLAFWLASRSTQAKKRSPSPTLIAPSESHLARIETDQAELFSTLEKLNHTVKRLSSRQGMRDVRDQQQSSAEPPIGTSKAELLRHYGMSGKVGPDFARAQQQLELDRKH
jgi:hypothetical protein